MSGYKWRYCFQNVVFGYEIDNPIIKGINLHIRQGEKVAIVGSSGAGKSTLINLLLRLYEPDNGSIYLNGVDIRDFDKGDLRSNFSIVSQTIRCSIEQFMKILHLAVLVHLIMIYSKPPRNQDR